MYKCRVLYLKDPIRNCTKARNQTAARFQSDSDVPGKNDIDVPFFGMISHHYAFFFFFKLTKAVFTGPQS